MKILAQHQSGRVTAVLFASKESAQKELAPFAAIPTVEIVRTHCLDKARRNATLIRALLWGRDKQMQALFHRHHVDIVFEVAQFFGWRLGLPAIAWIPDLQHRVLPQMFSLPAWWKREIGFRAQALAKRFFMLSSEDARRACERCYPDTLAREYSLTASSKEPNL